MVRHIVSLIIFIFECSEFLFLPIKRFTFKCAIILFSVFYEVECSFQLLFIVMLFIVMYNVKYKLSPNYLLSIWISNSAKYCEISPVVILVFVQMLIKEQYI